MPFLDGQLKMDNGKVLGQSNQFVIPVVIGSKLVSQPEYIRWLYIINFSQMFSPVFTESNKMSSVCP